MSRKNKVGLDYFSHDVDMKDDKKIRLIIAKHGLVGYGVYNRLLEEIYRESGYFVIVDPDFEVLFSDDCKIKYEDFQIILEDLILRGLFDKVLFKEFRILTSKRIQENYCAGTERRKEVFFINDYLMIDVESFYNLEKVNVNINGLNVDINEDNNDINPLNDDINKQSKVKEIERKEKQIELFEKAFEKWWLTYPKRGGRRIGKKDAKKLFLKISQKHWEELKTATSNYSAYLSETGLSPCDAKRFLNGLWKEYIEPPDKTGTSQDDGSAKAKQLEEDTKKYL